MDIVSSDERMGEDIRVVAFTDSDHSASVRFVVQLDCKHPDHLPYRDRRATRMLLFERGRDNGINRGGVG